MRYYFDIDSPDGPVRDEHGLEFSSPEALRREVAKILSELLCDEFPLHDHGVISVGVRDESGRAVLNGRASFSAGRPTVSPPE